MKWNPNPYSQKKHPLKGEYIALHYFCDILQIWL